MDSILRSGNPSCATVGSVTVFLCNVEKRTFQIELLNGSWDTLEVGYAFNVIDKDNYNAVIIR